MDAAVFANCVFPYLTPRERVKLRRICSATNDYVREIVDANLNINTCFEGKLVYFVDKRKYKKLDKKYAECFSLFYDYVRYNRNNVDDMVIFYIFYPDNYAKMSCSSIMQFISYNIFCGRYKTLTIDNLRNDGFYNSDEIMRLIRFLATVAR